MQLIIGTIVGILLGYYAALIQLERLENKSYLEGIEAGKTLILEGF